MNNNGDLVPRREQTPVRIDYKTGKVLRSIDNAARIELRAMLAIEHATVGAMFSAWRITDLQQKLELLSPAAADRLNIIAMSGCMTLAQRVQRFGLDIA